MSNFRTPPIKLRLFGGANLTGIDQATADSLLAQPKVVGLLAYLAITGANDVWVRRDILATLLWPELDQSHARAALRKGVLALRGALGADALLARGDEDLRFADDAIGCDVAQFDELIEQGSYGVALVVYRGDLLPGFYIPGCVEFDRWLSGIRAETRERASAAAWANARMLEEQSQMTDASLWARKAVKYSWDDERTLRRTLGLLDRAGDRAAALRLFDEFARRLKADLDAEPSPETLEVVRALRSSPPTGA